MSAFSRRKGAAAEREFINGFLRPFWPKGYCQCGCGKLTTLADDGQPRRWCQGHAANAARARSFDSHLETADRGYASACLVWTGGKTPNGYGIYRGFMAHRIAWLLTGRDIPEGWEVDHLCLQRDCVNPTHLEPVTHTENIRRSRATKLTQQVVDEMRSLHAAGAVQARIAERYGVSRSTVCRIVKGTQWAE